MIFFFRAVGEGEALLEPVVTAETPDGAGFVDRWVTYGTVNGHQYFTAKELTVDPGARCTVADAGAYGLITVQGEGSINGVRVSSPSQIRLEEMTEDEVFVIESAAKAGVTFENTSACEPLVMLRYFGPDVWDAMP